MPQFLLATIISLEIFWVNPTKLKSVLPTEERKAKKSSEKRRTVNEKRPRCRRFVSVPIVNSLDLSERFF